jgi:hypothetical protein
MPRSTKLFFRYRIIAKVLGAGITIRGFVFRVESARTALARDEVRVVQRFTTTPKGMAFVRPARWAGEIVPHWSRFAIWRSSPNLNCRIALW